MEHLFNIELYYTDSEKISGGTVSLSGDEYKHAAKVMRNRIGDVIYITDGAGSIYKSTITTINSEILSAEIVETIKAEKKLSKIYFCIPKLKNPDRFKFVLEKCVELGIINFIVFESERSIKSSSNFNRWEKIVIAAMKQSLRSYLPAIRSVSSLEEIKNFPGEKILFDQNGKVRFHFKCEPNKYYYFIFGPEGGLSKEELKIFNSNKIYTLSTNRLRSETAIIKTAALLQ